MSAPVPPARAPRALVALVALVALAALLVLPTTPGAAAPQPGSVRSARPSETATDDRRVLLRRTFDSRRARVGFRTLGPGRWSVAGGRYRVDGATTGRRSGRTSLSVMERRVAATGWRLTARVRVERGSSNAAIVFGFRDPRNYSFVDLSSRRGASAVVRVRDGAAVRLGSLRTRLRPGVSHHVRLQRAGDRLVVSAARGARRPGVVGTAPLGPGWVLRAGFGSTAGRASFDDLVVTVPARSESPPDPSVDPPPGGRAVAVATSDELTAALADARPGDVITVADGVYTTKGLQAPLEIGGKRYVGTFVASVSGTSSLPIVLQGTEGAIIDGKPGEVGTGTQYGLYLAGADHWSITGITVQNVAKGIVLDRSSHTTIAGVRVHTIGQEGIHLRSFSSDNVVRDNLVTDTGLKNENFGEGLYVGSANSNWSTYSDGRPDASDRNRLLGNRIARTGAESIDIKEGTTAGLVRGNVFEGSGMTGSFADSWVDVKGNRWRILSNTGTNALEDGFQVHGALAGWGLDNVFSANTADVNGPGYGFWLQNNVTGNVIDCATNVVRGAAGGFDNVRACPPTP